MFPSPSVLERRARVLHAFEILERIGAGGVGQVFLARSKGGKLVAIKVLSDSDERESNEAFSHSSRTGSGEAIKEGNLGREKGHGRLRSLAIVSFSLPRI